MWSKEPQFSRIGTLDMHSLITRKVGRPRAEKYFFLLKRFLHQKMTKLDFDRSCRITIGKENIKLHNLFLRAILKNSCLSHSPPIRDTSSQNSLISNISNGSFVFPSSSSPSHGKIRPLSVIDRKIKDRSSRQIPSLSGLCDTRLPTGHQSGLCDIRLPVGHQSGPELVSIGSKAPLEIISVEDGEEVEQKRDSPCVQSRSPIRAPLGIPNAALSLSGRSLSRFCQDSCANCLELPDSSTLYKRMEKKAKLHGLKLSEECADLLNTGLNAFLNRLIKPCVDLSRSVPENADLMIKGQSINVSLSDFRASMLTNRTSLGDAYATQLEKISFRSLQ